MLPEEDRATATGDLHKTFRGDRSSGFRDMLADRQTYAQTDRQTDRNTPLPYRGGVIVLPMFRLTYFCYITHTYTEHALCLGATAVRFPHFAIL